MVISEVLHLTELIMCNYWNNQEVLPDPNGVRIVPRLDAMKEKYEAKKNDGEPKVRKPRAPKDPTQPKKPKIELEMVCIDYLWICSRILD